MRAATIGKVLLGCGLLAGAVWLWRAPVVGQAQDRELVRVSTITEKGGRLDWSESLNLIAFDYADDDGYYDVYTMRPDGSGRKCLTCESDELPVGNAGNPSWHPSGNFIVFQAERDREEALSKAKQAQRGGGAFGRLKARRAAAKQEKMLEIFTTPGMGFRNDVWLMDREGKRYWKLASSNAQAGAILHPHFSPDGRKLVWGERISGAANGGGGGLDAEAVQGQWELKVADFDPSPRNPRLRNVQSYRPGSKNLYESHGFSPDGKKVLFTVDAGERYGYDIMLFDLTTKKVQNLTNTPDEWDEHAHFTPQGKIFYMSSRDLGLPKRQNEAKCDYWIMDEDGSNKRRLTYFNSPGSPEYISGGACAADSSSSPDGRTVAAYLITDYVKRYGKIMKLEFRRPI